MAEDTMNKAARVYVVQRVTQRGNDGEMHDKFDLTPALQYGQLVELISPNQSLFALVPIIRQLKQQLHDFTDDDYLLAIGDPSTLAAAAMIASERNDGRVNLLKWDRRTTRYIPLLIDIRGSAIPANNVN